MEETPNPTSQEANRSVLGPVIWQEVLRMVIAPRIARLVAEKGGEIENRQQLHRAFCDEHGIKPSYSTFSGWCEDLGISFRKRIEVSIPGWRDMPKQRTTRQQFAQPVAQEEPAGPDEPIEWDGPAQRPMVESNDGLPNVLPGGFRAPMFVEGGDFAN
jgi:hypothetical protein